MGSSPRELSRAGNSVLPWKRSALTTFPLFSFNDEPAAQGRGYIVRLIDERTGTKGLSCGIAIGTRHTKKRNAAANANREHSSSPVFQEATSELMRLV